MKVSNPAGFLNRFAANIVDLLVISVLTNVILQFQNYFLQNELNSVINFLYALLLPILWSGYTIGRRALGNRIVRMDGKKLGLGTMVMRFIIAGIIYALTLGIGLIVSAFMVGLREDKRAIHDFIAQTYVTKNQPKKIIES